MYGQDPAIQDLDFIISLKGRHQMLTVFALKLATLITDIFKTMDTIFDDLKSSMSKLRMKCVRQIFVVLKITDKSVLFQLSNIT